MDNLDSLERSYKVQKLGESAYSTQLLAAAKLLGYKRMPPTIEQFIEDDYYLGKTFGKGKLYPYWKQVLMDIFPTPIHTRYLIITLTGAIGSGKSTLAKIIAEYNKCRIDHLKNFDFFGLARTKAIDFMFFHVSASKAQADFIDSIQMIEKESPYFSGGMLSNWSVNYKVDGARSNNSIGGDVLFYNLSELNFVKEEVAWYKLDQSLKRFRSRYQKIIGYFGNIIIDTSSRGDDTIVEKFIQDNPFENVLTIRAAIWDAKAHLGIYFKKGSFDVYAGDSTNPPFIVTDPSQITEEMDAERVIKCPMELYADFKFNIEAALQDMAGISTKSSGKLFNDLTPVKESCKLPMHSEEILTVDFFNKSDKLIYQLDRYLRDIPDDKIIFPRYDIGVTGDNAGLAITYFDKYKFYDATKKVRQPIYKTPLAVALSRLQNQETSIYHLFEFILDLKDRFEIGEFTADQFASRQLLQDLTREGVRTRLLSVDRTDTPYLYFKNMVNNGLWSGPSSKLLTKELCELNWKDGKVDHPCTGSKDIADAVSGSVWSCYENLDLAAQFSTKYRVEIHNNWLNERRSDPGDQVQDMLNRIF